MNLGLLLALVSFAWGAHAVLPWRLRRGDREGVGRGGWARAALPVLLAGALGALLYARARPDAALASGVLPLTANHPGRLLLLLAAAVLAVDLVLTFGWRRLEDAGWKIAAVFGLLLAAAAAFAAELMRVGEGPGGPLLLLAGAAACRLGVLLAAGELTAPGRSWLPPLAGLALPLYLYFLPEELRHPFLAGGHWLTLGAAALLLLASRWLPTRLRRPGLAAAVVLASLAFAQAAEISQSLSAQPLPPLPPLAVP